MITDCKIKTITEINEGRITISSFSSEEQNGVEKPTLFRADLLDKCTTLNKVEGKEGELLLTHTDSNQVIGEIDKDGNLLITLDDDDVDKYYIDDNGDLKYIDDDGQ